MITKGLEKISFLGDDITKSSVYFDSLFAEPTKMPKFKALVSTSEDRWKNRAFNNDSTVSEGFRSVFTGTTNYNAILTNIKKTQGSGSFGQVANIKFLIDANNKAISKAGAGSLAFMHSDKTHANPADQLYQPVHRLLVEEHVFAFIWTPTLSSTYYAVTALIAAAKLTSSVISTVGTLGATTPALINSICDAVSTGKEIINLLNDINEAKGILLDGATEAIDLAGEAYSNAKAAYDPVAAAGGEISGSLIAGGGGTTLDLGAHTIENKTQKVKGYFYGERDESEDEKNKRLGKERLERENEVGKLNFIVVQHITPVMQVRDDVDVADPSNPNATFQLKTYMLKESLVRAGETTRDKYNQMILGLKTETFDKDSAAEIFCRPWSVEGLYSQFKIAYAVNPGTGIKADDVAFKKLNWNLASEPSWELVDERPGTLPLPQAILNARIRLQEQAKAQALAKQERAKTTLRNRLQSAHNAAIALNLLIQNSNLPTKEEFKKRTTTHSLGGLYVNKRTNQKLILIDMTLEAWHQIKKQSRDRIKLTEALTVISEACGEYIQEKTAASREGSERVPEVRKLKEQVDTLSQSL